MVTVERAKKIRAATKAMAKHWKAARAKVEPIGGGGGKDGAIGGGG